MAPSSLYRWPSGTIWSTPSCSSSAWRSPTCRRVFCRQSPCVSVSLLSGWPKRTAWSKTLSVRKFSFSCALAFGKSRFTMLGVIAEWSKVLQWREKKNEDPKIPGLGSLPGQSVKKFSFSGPDHLVALEPPSNQSRSNFSLFCFQRWMFLRNYDQISSQTLNLDAIHSPLSNKLVPNEGGNEKRRKGRRLKAQDPSEAQTRVLSILSDIPPLELILRSSIVK